MDCLPQNYTAERTTKPLELAVKNVRPNVSGHKSATFDLRFGAVTLSGWTLSERGTRAWITPPAGVTWTDPDAGQRVSNSVIGQLRRKHPTVLRGEFRP